MKSKFYYEARCVFGLSALLPCLLLPAYGFVLFLSWGNHPPAELRLVIRAFELIVPMAAALSAAHLMAVEREEGFSELRQSYPEPAWQLPLLRTAGAFVLMLITLVLGGTVLRYAYGPYPLRETALASLPPALVLLGLSLLVSNLTGSYWVATAAAMGYWLLEVVTKGSVTEHLFLFHATWPVEDVSHSLNRGLLAGLGTLLLLTNIGLYLYRPRS